MQQQSPLMNLEQIAEMLYCDVRHVRDRIVLMPGFPRPSPVSTPRRRLWVRDEVVKFVTRGGSTGTDNAC